MVKRVAVIKRESSETRIDLELDIDGTGAFEIDTGVGMLDHLLAQVAKHGRFDIKIRAKGDLEVNEHHTVEDVGISLGLAFKQALGERKGIVRMGHALVPMDEALALVAVDLSGRGCGEVEVSFDKEYIGELPTDLVGHFLESFATEGRLNLHAKLLAGRNDHHKVEALFKALARALDEATRIDERITGEVPSTKDVLD
ncbi:MAG TPA: imidazoleglycerol-phosphate dehydratase HisB [Dehalococcoidia bacterium]|nr:imidazoleglycerol-phosphate dehydratase HisB [Dehalococcoidia bacterium]